MIPLGPGPVPEDAEALARRLEAAIRSVVRLPQGRPTITVSGDLPELSLVSVNLSGGAMSSALLREVSARTERIAAGPRAKRLEVAGQPLLLGDASAELAIEAEDVEFEYRRASGDRLVLGLAAAGSATARFSTGREQLERLAKSALSDVANRHGVQVVSVSIDLATPEAMSVTADVLVTVKKLFKARVRASGRVDVDERMVARLSDLSVKGEGMAGAAVAKIVEPPLRGLQGREMTLAPFLPRGLVLEHFEIVAGESVKVRSRWGTAPGSLDEGPKKDGGRGAN